MIHQLQSHILLGLGVCNHKLKTKRIGFLESRATENPRCQLNSAGRNRKWHSCWCELGNVGERMVSWWESAPSAGISSSIFHGQGQSARAFGTEAIPAQLVAMAKVPTGLAEAISTAAPFSLAATEVIITVAQSRREKWGRSGAGMCRPKHWLCLPRAMWEEFRGSWLSWSLDVSTS